MPRIQQLGTISKSLKGHLFEVALDDMPEHKVIAVVSGKMRIGHITLNTGDSVDVELSPYDLERGRIIWRNTVV